MQNMIATESPLNGINIGNIDTVLIREWPGLHTIDLRVPPGTESQIAVTKALGIHLPDRTGLTSVSGKEGSKIHALCLAPDHWLIIGFPDAEYNLAPLKLNDEFHFSIVNVSGQRTTIELEGPKSREVLAHIWEQDLREKNFPVGSVSQGLIAKAPVIVYHIGPMRYSVMVRSSFALHLWKVLIDAAEEWIG